LISSQTFFSPQANAVVQYERDTEREREREREPLNPTNFYMIEPVYEICSDKLKSGDKEMNAHKPTKIETCRPLARDQVSADQFPNHTTRNVFGSAELSKMMIKLWCNHITI
jgi:hypothetical protein